MRKLIFILFFLINNLAYSQSSTKINFSLENLDGDIKSLEEFTEKGPVYISFWALWCRSCRSELKILETIYNNHKEKGITILAINIDTPKSMAKVKSYIASQNFSFPNLIDPNSRVFEMLNGKELPYSLLLDKEGKIKKTRRGFLPGDEKHIEEDILKILNE